MRMPHARADIYAIRRRCYALYQERIKGGGGGDAICVVVQC